MERKARNELIDVLKGVTIILVILGHSIQYGTGLDYRQDQEFFNNIVFKFIYSFHMPLFMLISGYLFKFSISNHTFNENLKSRFVSILLPVFSWATLRFAITFAINPVFTSSMAFVKSFILTFSYTLWFLWAIFFCSLAVLFVNKFAKDNIFIYLLGFVATFLIPDILELASIKFMYPYFVLGYFFSVYSSKKAINKIVEKNTLALFLSLTIIFGGLLVFFNHDSYIYTTKYYIFNGNTLNQFGIDIYRTIIGLVGSMWVIIFVKLCLMKTSAGIISLMTVLGKNSLGLYIISGYIFPFLLYPLTKDFIKFNYGVILVETAVIVLISYLGTLILKKYRLTNVLLLGNR